MRKGTLFTAECLFFCESNIIDPIIDWSKPIETMPCKTNLKPVACVYDPKEHAAGLLGSWRDPSDGSNEGPETDGPTPYMWKLDEKGRFISLRGRVRNVSS
jgi:hypothetical protein